MIQADNDIRVQITADRAETRQKIARAVALGLPLLANTNLMWAGAPIGTHEVMTTQQLIQAIAPVDFDNYRLHEHLQFTAKVARKIGERLQQKQSLQYANLNLDELEIVGLLHDSGRTITHAWFRNDLIGGHLLKKLGIRGDITPKIPPIKIFIKKDPGSQEQINKVFNDLSIEHKIMIMADLCGKRQPNGGILSFDEVIQICHKTTIKRYEATAEHKLLYPSQRLLTQDVIDFSEKVYRKLYTFFDSLGVNLEEIRREIIKEEDENPIQAVIFDVGGVLISNPHEAILSNEAILPNIAQAFQIEPETALQAWEEHIPQLQVGKLTEEEFWRAYAAAVQKPLPNNYTALLMEPRSAREIRPEMRKIIDRIRVRGLKLGILSDTVEPHMRENQAKGVYDGFDAVSLSPQIKSTKMSEAAFRIAALRLWLPPQACIFIDDRKAYADRASHIGMKGIHFESPQQLEMALKEKGILA